MLSLFVAAFFYLGCCSTPLPARCSRKRCGRGARGGFRPALSVQLGSLAGDALWAVLGLAGVGLLAQAESLRVPVGVAGVLYLLWLAIDSWRAARAELGLCV